MLSHRILLAPLLAVVLLGCIRTDPAPAPPAPAPPAGKGKDVAKPTNKGTDDLKKQIENAEAELEQLAVFFVISGVRDEKHFGDIYMKVQGLTDAAAKNARAGIVGQYLWRNAANDPLVSDRIVQASPISDPEAAAAKVDFAKVTAVDVVDRIILLDASAKAVPRPEKGWPGAKAVNQYVVRKAAQFFTPENYATEALKKFDRDQLVLICGSNEFPAAAVLDKLKELAPVTPTVYKTHEFGPVHPGGQKQFSIYVMAPVEKMSEVVKLLAGAENVGVDEELRFVLIGLDSAKPPKAKVKPPAPPK